MPAYRVRDVAVMDRSEDRQAGGVTMSVIESNGGKVTITAGPEHPVEKLYPEQTKAFREILDRMYNLHLAKNADYSPNNVLGYGIIGVATRLWDKVSRLMNLVGFNTATGEFTAPKEPRNESIDDTLLDLAVYAVIGLILRQGKWGK